MRYLIDTNILSYLFVDQEKVVNRIRALKLEDVCVSSITCAEISFGIHHATGNRQQIIRDQFERFIRTIEVQNFDLSAACVFGAIKKQTRSKGKSLDDLDLQIAAIAIANNLALVTNDKAFGTIRNLTTENWMV